MNVLLGFFLFIVCSGTPLYFFFDFGAITFFGIILSCGGWALLQFGIFRRIPIRRRDPESDGARPRATSAEIDPFPTMGIRRLRIPKLLVCILFTAACAVSLIILWKSAVTHSITDPWQAIPRIFFLGYFVQSLLLISVLVAGCSRACAAIGIALHSLVSLAVIPLVYPLGYGFDPVIHQQAEQIIASTGTLSPKTLYYTGQYILLVFLAKITSIPLEQLDRLLLPLIASAAVPIFALRAFERLGTSVRFASLAAMAASLGLIPAIASPTPWGWSVFLFAIFIFASIEFFGVPDKRQSFCFLGLISVASLFIHPIAGLPMMAAFILFAWLAFGVRYRKCVAFLLVAAGGLSVPTAFLFNSGATALLGLQTLALPLPELLWRFDAVRDPLYAVAAIMPLVIACAWIAGSRILLRSHPLASMGIFGLSAILAIGCIVMRYLLSFPFLIDYEQTNYADRLLSLFFLSTLPVAIIGIKPLFNRLISANGAIRTTGLYLTAGILVGTLYLSYPRNDPYESTHGYNISAADLSAVEYIKKDGENDPYVVLSNQVSSGAAIKKSGFVRYVDFATDFGRQNVFYYPVPTSSPLYQSFLAMLKKPSREIIEDAMRRANVHRAYFIAHRYEPRGPNILKEAESLADASALFGDGEIGVFLFKLQ